MVRVIPQPGGNLGVSGGVANAERTGAATPELVAFERRKRELCERFPGQFAILVGETLVGVEVSLEAALATTADRLDQGTLPGGIPILISEIAEQPRLRVTHLGTGAGSDAPAA